MNLENGINGFLSSISAERNLSERTLKAYQSDLRLLQDEFKNMDIDCINADDLRKFIHGFEVTRNYKDNTIRRKIAALKVFFSFLEDEGTILVSPTRKLKHKYRIAQRLPKVMTSREVKRLLSAAHREVLSVEEDTRSAVFPDDWTRTRRFRAYRDRAILEILFSTGMRIGELEQLSLNDVNIQERTILIFGKGRKERIIYISSDEVLAAIKEYFIIRLEIKTDHANLLLNKNRSSLSIYSIENIFKKYCRAARIRKHYTPHCLRHTMATLLLDHGADIRQVQEILGHSSIVVTQIYTEVTPKQKRKVLMKYNHRNRINLGYH